MATITGTSYRLSISLEVLAEDEEALGGVHEQLIGHAVLESEHLLDLLRAWKALAREQRAEISIDPAEKFAFRNSSESI